MFYVARIRFLMEMIALASSEIMKYKVTIS